MNFDVLDSLEDLGYCSVKEDCNWKEALEVGPKSSLFTQLVEWLSKELQSLCRIDSCVHAIADPSDSSSFLLEVSSFLKELQCPYKALVSGPISQRLLDVKSRLVLLDYLCTELQAVRLLHQKAKTKISPDKVEENQTVAYLNAMRNVLDVKVDSDRKDSKDGLSDNALITEVEEKVSHHLLSHPDAISNAAVEEDFSNEQWNDLNVLYEDFTREYSVRREMLLTRLDVTIQSFKWGEGSKGKEEKIFNAYAQKRKNLKKTPSVKLSDLIAARESIFIIEKTSSDTLVKNTKSSLNRILIDAVPDRGGRPREQRPAKEMPKWNKRDATREGNHRRGGNRQQKKFKGPKDKNKDQGGHFDAAGTY